MRRIQRFSERGHNCVGIFSLWPIRVSHEARTEPRFVSGPRSCNSAAEDRRTEHRAFETCFAVDVAAGHAGNFASSVQPRNRFEVFSQNAATKVGLHTAKVFPRERK